MTFNYKGKNPFVRSVLTHAPKYLSASVISSIVGMLMTKYYTSVFDPAQFGILSLYVLLFQYMQNLVAFTVDSSSQRVYFDYQDQDRKQFLGTVSIFMIVCSCFWITIALIFKDLFISHFGGNNLIFITTIISTVLYIFVNFFNRICYNEYESKLVFSQNILQSFLYHFISFISISIFSLGVLGRQIGQACSLAVNAVVYYKKLRKLGHLIVEYKVRIDILKRVFYFSFPTFCTIVLLTSFSYLDRVLLKVFHGNTEVGLYSLGYTIGQAMGFVVEAVSLAVIPSLMKGLKEGIKNLKKFDSVFCSCLFLLSIIIFLLRDFIILILSNKGYLQAAKIMPFIVFTYTMNGFYKNVSSLLSYHNIVWIFPVLSACSFGTAAICNYRLIPNFHEIGAAYSTFIGMFIYSFAIHVIGSKYYFSLYYIIPIYVGIFIMVTSLFYSFI